MKLWETIFATNQLSNGIDTLPESVGQVKKYMKDNVTIILEYLTDDLNSK